MKVWSLSREDLESELKDNPDFAVGLLRKLAEEMRGQSKARIDAVCMVPEVWRLKRELRLN